MNSAKSKLERTFMQSADIVQRINVKVPRVTRLLYAESDDPTMAVDRVWFDVYKDVRR
jgi:hypothetical protein